MVCACKGSLLFAYLFWIIQFNVIDYSCPRGVEIVGAIVRVISFRFNCAMLFCVAVLVF